MIPVVGGKYKVWTKKLGSGPIKVLLLHGGPGFSHEYLETFEDFLPPAGIEMYNYDQLDVNNSDQPDDPSLWTIARYVEEVGEVRQGLGLDRFVLLGHSWDGTLAIDYGLKYQSHLRGLVISNMTAGMTGYLKRMVPLKNLLSPASGWTRWAPSRTVTRLMMEELYPR
jgi:proline iminopeptidase